MPGRAAWRPPAPRPTSGLPAKYVTLVGQANLGAVSMKAAPNGHGSTTKRLARGETGPSSDHCIPWAGLHGAAASPELPIGQNSECYSSDLQVCQMGVETTNPRGSGTHPRGPSTG
jgi:hypothetical protein